MADSADSDMEKVKVAFNVVLNTAVLANKFQLAQGATSAKTPEYPATY